jgi:hypothetical protein
VEGVWHHERLTQLDLFCLSEIFKTRKYWSKMSLSQNAIQHFFERTKLKSVHWPAFELSILIQNQVIVLFFLLFLQGWNIVGLTITNLSVSQPQPSSLFLSHFPPIFLLKFTQSFP